jgi:Right handed beta helix region/Bacterial Ig-like domain
VIRLGVLVAALAAALFTAPSALATGYTVNDPGSATDPVALNACATAQPGCTLPAAIQTANTTAAVADTITFTGAGTAPGPFTAPLPQVTDALVIDGGGATTVTFDATATGLLLDVQAANSTIKSTVFTGGGSPGAMLNLAGSGDHLDTVTVRDTPATGVRIAGASNRVDGSTLQRTGVGIAVIGANATISSPAIVASGGRGIEVAGTGTTITQPDITGVTGPGVLLSGSGASISGGKIYSNRDAGVAITGQNNRVSRVLFYDDGGNPIDNSPGANGGIAPPQNMRIGPRRADGSLPLTGNASGSVELWSGNPATTTPPSFLAAFSSGGDFTYTFPSEPAPGSVFAASVTGAGGTSEFATVAVPNDVASPTAGFARALDTSNVRVDFSEPLDPASVQPEDFKLTMAGAERAISGLSVAPDGRFVTLSSSGWQAGEAGYVDVTSAGAVNDASGNAILTAPRLRVAAAPGDFLAPLGGRLSVSPRTICLTSGRGCRRTGMTIKFITSEAGKARLVIKRSNKTVGTRLYGNIVPGLNTLKFNGRLNSRKLRAGRYRLLMYVQDKVGNITDQPPIVLFNVKRVTK